MLSQQIVRVARTRVAAATTAAAQGRATAVPAASSYRFFSAAAAAKGKKGGNNNNSNKAKAAAPAAAAASPAAAAAAPPAAASPAADAVFWGDATEGLSPELADLFGELQRAHTPEDLHDIVADKAKYAALENFAKASDGFDAAALEARAEELAKFLEALAPQEGADNAELAALGQRVVAGQEPGWVTLNGDGKDKFYYKEDGSAYFSVPADAKQTPALKAALEAAGGGDENYLEVNSEASQKVWDTLSARAAAESEAIMGTSLGPMPAAPGVRVAAGAGATVEPFHAQMLAEYAAADAEFAGKDDLTRPIEEATQTHGIPYFEEQLRADKDSAAREALAKLASIAGAAAPSKAELDAYAAKQSK